jgi:uncharacterized membrane protein
MSKGEPTMQRTQRILNILLIGFLLSLASTGIAFAQDGDPALLAPFTPILAGAAAVERLLQLVRNLISPDPEKGLLARNTTMLRYFTTIGGVVLGLLIAFMSDLHMLAAAGIKLQSGLDLVLTGVVIGMGTELVHEIIKVVGEGKLALRGANSASEH